MAPTVPDWTYQPPYRPKTHPDQCYYGAAADGSTGHHIAPYADNADAHLTLFRFADEAEARLTLSVPAGELRATFTVAQLRALRNALNAALADIAQATAQAEAERERRESFYAIQAELREADERGCGSATGVLYAHPDVHYVAPHDVAAKVAELRAAGAQRYIVLPIDPAEGADDARSTRHHPAREREGALA